MTNYTVADAIEMMRDGGIDFASELSNIAASYADITDEIEQAGGEPDFDITAYEIALRTVAMEG
jgi:hypothetical protein